MIKKALYTALTFFVLFLIVFTSQGLTIGKMVCLESGEITLKLEKVYDCCESNSNEDCIQDAPCCAINNISISLDIYILTPKLNLLPQGGQISSGNWLLVLANTTLQPLQSIKEENNSPPFYKSTTQTLSCISVYRI